MPFSPQQHQGYGSPEIYQGLQLGGRAPIWHPFETAIFTDIRRWPGSWEDRAGFLRDQLQAAQDRARAFQAQQPLGYQNSPAGAYHDRYSALGVPERDYTFNVMRFQARRFDERSRANAGPAWESPYYVGPSLRGYDYFGRRF